MRKITKKRKTNIKHYKGVGGKKPPPTYEEALDNTKEIFGKTLLKNVLKYGNYEQIEKFITLIKIEKQEKQKKYNNKMSNEEQISDILYPALEKFLDYIKIYKVTRFGITTTPFSYFIPRIVNVSTILKESRIIKILTLAEEKKLENDELIEEFIQSLEVLKSTFSSPPPPPPSNSLPESAPNSLPELEPPPPPPSNSLPESASLPPPQHSLPEPASLPPPSFSNPQRESSNKSITPSRSLSRSLSRSSSRSLSRSSSISSYNDALTSLSRSPSISSYNDALTSLSRSPSMSPYKIVHTSPKAIRKTPYSYLKKRLHSIQPITYFKRAFGSKKSKPKLVAIHRGGGKNYKTRNKVYSSHKKTRRHKTRNI
jgi:hypothetical protein